MATTPTPAGLEKAKTVRNWLDATAQQKYMDSNKGFDFAKYGMTIKPVTPTAPVNNTPIVTGKQQSSTAVTPNNINNAQVTNNSVPPVKPTTIKTENGKSYDITVDPTTGKASFTSQATWGGTVVKNSLKEATDYINANNKKIIQPVVPAKNTKVIPTKTVTTPNANSPEVKQAAQEAADLAAKKDDSPARLTEVSTNLSNLTNTNPELFKDRGALDAYVDYKDRSLKQKEVIDNFWNEKGKQTMFNQMPSDNLGEAISNGTYAQADLDYMKATNSQKYAEVMEAKAAADIKLANNIAIQSYSSLLWDGDKNGTPDFIDKLNAKTDEAQKTLEDYVAAKSTPEMQQAVTEMNGLTNEITDLQDQQMRIQKDIEKQYGSLPKSLVSAMVADQTNDIQSQIVTKTNLYNSKLWTYNSRLSNLKDAFEANTARISAEKDKVNTALTSLQTIMNIGATVAATQAKAIDPNIGKTTDVYNSKWKKIGTMQWNTKTQAYDIPVAGTAMWGSWGWGGWGGWSGGSTSYTSAAAIEAGTTLDNLANTTLNERRGAMLWKFSWIISTKMTKLQADYKWIQKNLMFKDFITYKKEWATFGAMSEQEWASIQAAASKLDWGMSDADRKHEIDIIRWKLKAAAAKWGASATPLTGNQSTVPASTPTTINNPVRLWQFWGISRLLK